MSYLKQQSDFLSLTKGEGLSFREIISGRDSIGEYLSKAGGYNQLKEMSVEDISFTINCSNMEKYTLNYNQISNKLGIQNDLDEFKMELHCPYHIRSSHAYNVILKRLGLQNKYDLIRSGDKVKIIRVTEDNKYKIKVLSYKDKYPEEFKSIFKIDYDAIFDKIIFSMVERFYNIVMWEATRPTEAVHTDLFDFLS